MASTSEIKKGLCIRHSHDIFKVVEFLHVKPGKGAAFVRTKLKSVTTGKVLDNTFPAGHQIEIVRVERRNYQFLYNDETGMNFMNNETYDQISINPDMVENGDLLKEGAVADILFASENEVPLTVEIPQTVILEVTYTEPGLKGDTSTNSLKPAKVETGAEIYVPLFVKEGDLIKINTEDRAYLERANAK
jgi:elongation factor P